MAELVDALVSNTSDSNVVPVRPRLWVLKRKAKGRGQKAKVQKGEVQKGEGSSS